MKAITTKYHGPTRTRAARISATDGDGNRITVPYPDNANWGDDDAHRVAVRALCKKMGWTGRLAPGALLRGGHTLGYVYVWAKTNVWHTIDIYHD